MSFHNKSASIVDLVISKKLDILALTETWLNPDDTTSCISDICPPYYSFYHQPRQPGRESKVPFCPDIFYFRGCLFIFRLLPMSLSPSWNNFILLCWLLWFTRKLSHYSSWIFHHWWFQPTFGYIIHGYIHIYRYLSNFDLKQHVLLSTHIHDH